MFFDPKKESHIEKKLSAQIKSYPKQDLLRENG